MSTNELDNGGTDGTTTNTSGDDGGGGGFNIQINAADILPDWIVTISKIGPGLLVQFVRSPRAVLVALLTTGAVTYGTAKDRLAAGESAIEIIMEQYLFQKILLPAGTAVFESILQLVSVILSAFAFVGSIPITIAESFGLPIIAAGTGLAAEIDQLNRTIAQEVATVGLPAPVFVAVFTVAELGVFAYAVWIVLQIAENFFSPVLPVEITDTLRVATAPIRNFLKGLT